MRPLHRMLDCHPRAVQEAASKRHELHAELARLQKEADEATQQLTMERNRAESASAARDRAVGEFTGR